MKSDGSAPNIADSRWSDARDLFEQAIERKREERAEFVEMVAADDPWLRAAVLDLLDRDELSSPLDRALAQAEEARAGSSRVKVGEWVDRYHLLAEIGAGGMGTVFHAERVEGPVHQQVAIKVLHAHLSADTQRRFAQEQRLLAELQHPQIARLLDFGVTPDGVSYLVMNLVRGESITRYADRHQLGIEQRLGLFLQVCEAVRYAHRQLVVHRDLKPANVLVEEGGEVQLVDFGIAKLLAPEEHLEGTATRTEQRVLTPGYASPEQLFGRSITTATDLWALGVLLFELLTGNRPFDWQGKSLLEVGRQIERQPAVRASAAFRDAEEGVAERSLVRAADPAALRRRLKGDLDLIVARTLSDDKGRRYDSVGDLARDLHRWLDHRPILARRPSWIYRTSKLLRRRPLAALVAFWIVLFLAGFSVLQARQSQRLTQERDLARQQRDKAELMGGLLSEVLGLADPRQRKLSAGAEALLDRATQRVVDDFGDQPGVRADLLARIGTIYMRLGKLDRAKEVLGLAIGTGQAMDLVSVEHGRALDSLGFTYHELRDQRALPTLARALAVLERAHGGDHRDVTRSLMHLAIVLRARGDLSEAEMLLNRAKAMDRRLGDSETAEAGSRLTELGTLLANRGQRQQALEHFDQALAILRRAWGDHSVPVGLALSRKAALFQDRPQAKQAVDLLQQARGIFSDLLGESHPLTITSVVNLASAHNLLGNWSAAERLQRQGWALDLEHLGPEHPSTLDDRHRLALILAETDRSGEAVVLLAETVSIQANAGRDQSPAMIEQRIDLVRLLTAEGRAVEAGEHLAQAVTTARARLGSGHWLVGSGGIAAAELALLQGDLIRARDLAQEALGILSLASNDLQLWRAGEARSTLGEALARLGHPEPARQQLEEALDLLRELRGDCRASRLAERRLQGL